MNDSCPSCVILKYIDVFTVAEEKTSGHSFTVRLGNWCRENGKQNMETQKKKQWIIFCAKGGKYIDQMDFKDTKKHKPAIVCIEIGSNDIETLVVEEKSIRAYELARHMYNFSQDLLKRKRCTKSCNS